MPQFLIIAGPNGAGKSTFSAIFSRPQALIFDPDKERRKIELQYPDISQDAVESALTRVYEDIELNALESQLHFTIETNLRNEFLAERASVFKKLRYETRLIYMLLPNIASSMDRVNQRVKQKGHYVDPESIKLNFEAGLENLRKVAPRFDRLMLVSAVNDFAIKTQPRLLLTLTNGITKFRSKEIPKWSEKIVDEVELAVYRHWK